MNFKNWNNGEKKKTYYKQKQCVLVELDLQVQ